MIPHDAAWLCLAEAGEIPIFRHFVLEGGWVTWFVLIPLSFVGLALTIHYALTIRRRVLMPASLGEKLMPLLRDGRIDPAIELGRASRTILGSLVAAGLERIRQGPEAARSAFDEALEVESARLMRRIEVLNIIGSISPMIGLFGTVVGMIRAFNRMAGMEGGMANAANAARLSGDISVAFVNTFWGLLIAIPALAIFALFRNKVEAIADESSRAAERLVNAANLRYAGGVTESRLVLERSQASAGI